MKPGRDKYCILKKKTGGRTKIIDIHKDNDLRKSKEEQFEDNEKIIKTLESWSKSL